MKKMHWGLALLVETLCMLVLSFLLPFVCVHTGIAWLYTAAVWIVLPLLGAVISCRAVRRSLNNYAAVLPIPVCFTAGHVLAVFYLPSGFAMLLSALLAVIGSAIAVEKEKRA